MSAMRDVARSFPSTGGARGEGTIEKVRRSLSLPRGTASRALGAAALGVAGAGALAVLARRTAARNGVPSAPRAPLSDHFDAAALAPNRRYRRVSWALAAAGGLLGPTSVIALAATGPRWRPALARAAGGRPWRAGLAFGAGTAVAGAVAGLPLAAARYAWGRRGGLVVPSERRRASSWRAGRPAGGPGWRRCRAAPAWR
jgi:hypothetical protein